MGIDIVMKVIGTLSTKDFLRECKAYTLQPTPEEELLIRKWMQQCEALANFFENIELSFDDYYVNFLGWPEGTPANISKSVPENIDDISVWYPWVFFEILLNELNVNAYSFCNYCKVFEQLGDDIISIDESKVKILIHYESSYKGSEELDIDYEDLIEKINGLKANYSNLMHVHTTLTAEC
jgi:hypothetical protein